MYVTRFLIPYILYERGDLCFDRLSRNQATVIQKMLQGFIGELFIGNDGKHKMYGHHIPILG